MSQTREVPSASKAEVYRIVLAPNPGTLWTELGIMSRRIEEEARNEGRDDVVGWTEEEALEIEAVILVRSLFPSHLGVLESHFSPLFFRRTAPPHLSASPPRCKPPVSPTRCFARRPFVLQSASGSAAPEIATTMMKKVERRVRRKGRSMRS
jgi:hypothetical protein